jgi:hypothetical protein
MPRHVRRIEVDKVPAFYVGKYRLEVIASKGNFVRTKCSRASNKIVFIGDEVRLWSSKRNIEFAVSIHAIQAIPARLIQIDELGGAFKAPSASIASDSVEGSLPWFPGAEVLHDLARVVS